MNYKILCSIRFYLFNLRFLRSIFCSYSYNLLN